MVCMVTGAKFSLHFSLLRVKMDAEKTTVALKEVNILPSVLELTLVPIIQFCSMQRNVSATCIFEINVESTDQLFADIACGFYLLFRSIWNISGKYLDHMRVLFSRLVCQQLIERGSHE